MKKWNTDAAMVDAALKANGMLKNVRANGWEREKKVGGRSCVRSN
jgi:hypothetical protein